MNPKDIFLAAMALLGAHVKINLGSLQARPKQMKSSGSSGLDFESSSSARARKNWARSTSSSNKYFGLKKT